MSSGKKQIVPRLFKGTQDFLPEEMIRKQALTEIIRTVFERYGFEPVETPAMEYRDILMGKYGEEGEKLIYPLAYKDGRTLALRYDLTVPLARLVAMHPELPMPFKRYQIQPVWRAEKAQIRQGRFREFYQCDVDTVGTASMLADAEIIVMTDECLRALGIEKFVTRLSSRKLLFGMARHFGTSEERLGEFTRAIDKLDKVGIDGVRGELVKCGYAEDAADSIVQMISIEGSVEEKLARLEEALSDLPQALEGIAEIRQVAEALHAGGIDENRWTFEPALARGLDYYTGPIFETILPEQPHIGSLAGGGRYDDLIEMYAGSPVPATGTTVGIDRIYAAMLQLDLLPKTTTSTDVLVCLFDKGCVGASLKAANALREAGLNVMTYPQPDKLKKQFAYADKRNIPAVAVLGPDEVREGSVTLKDMKSGRQKSLPIGDLPAEIKGILNK